MLTLSLPMQRENPLEQHACVALVSFELTIKE
jgi:hypothetical protein